MILKQRMKGVVSDPSLVPEHVIAQVSDFAQDLADVVDRTVVRRELDAGQPEWARGSEPLRVCDERVLANLLAKVVLVPGVPVDGAYHAEWIPGGRQKDGNSTRLDERTLVQ